MGTREGLQVKKQRGLDIGYRGFVAIALTNDDVFDAEWVRYVGVRMLFDDDFDRFHLLLFSLHLCGYIPSKTAI